MEIEQAKAFVSRLSRTGGIPSGLSIALGAIFLRLEEQAAELKKARQEIDALAFTTGYCCIYRFL